MGRKRLPRRTRVGQVSYYQHHGAWYIYYRDGRRQVRRRVGTSAEQAAQLAAQINAQLATSLPTPFGFTPITVAELRQNFLDHHEHVLRSTLATVRRYRAATNHLEQFVAQLGRRVAAHEVPVDQFVRHLRSVKVAPNGHANTQRRRLRDKGVWFVLGTCRSMYGFAAKRRHLPPYRENPFAGLGGRRARIEDAKPIFVFDADSELRFFEAADDWTFGLHFTLAKTGMRPGEAIHILIEDLDLAGGWLHVRNKPDLGWRIKTGCERDIPLAPEVVAVLRRVIGGRKDGPVFLRHTFRAGRGALNATDRKSLARHVQQRMAEAERQCQTAPSRAQAAKLAHTVWRDAGATTPDRVRVAFRQTMQAIGLPEVTCPKSWRHTFATLLQDANVDPLVGQLTLGHQLGCPSLGALGMTSVYTHTRMETQLREINRAIQLWPRSLELAQQWAEGGQTSRK